MELLSKLHVGMLALCAERQSTRQRKLNRMIDFSYLVVVKFNWRSEWVVMGWGGDRLVLAG